MRRRWIFKNAWNLEENSRVGNHGFFAQKDEILLSMLTEVEFKVIRGLRTDTGDYTIGEEKSLLVPTLVGISNTYLNLTYLSLKP